MVEHWECQGCPFADVATTSEWFPQCPQRRDQVDTINSGCPRTNGRPIFGCTVHGQCVLTQRDREDAPGTRCCATCEQGSRSQSLGPHAASAETDSQPAQRAGEPGRVVKLTTQVSPPIADTLRCDVIVPYSEVAYPFLREAIVSILNQNFVETTIHLVADGITYDTVGHEFSQLTNVRLYANIDGPTGPYVIYNRIQRYLEHDVWANQDADDISLPNRLWKSLRLISDGYDIVGGSMEQFVDYRFSSDWMQKAVRRKPYHMCGTRYKASPSGNIVNSTMAIRKSVYVAANGMANWTAGADSEFIERCVLAGYRCAAMQDVVALRRLNEKSLSNGLNGHGSDYREQVKQWTAASIERQRTQTDHSIGGLAAEHDSESLIRVS